MFMRMQRLVRIGVVGDDSLVGFEFDVEPIAEDIARNIRAFGFVAKAEHSADIRDVTFLGMMPYPVGGSWLWGPTLGRRMYKAYFMASKDGNLPAWVNGVARQLLLFRHCPILYESAEQITSLLAGKPATKVEVDPNRLWFARSEPTPHYDWTTIDFLCYRYGVTRYTILRDLKIIAAIRRLPCVVHLETVFRACMIDDH